MKKIFFDTEFTGLHQNTTLISIGLIAKTDETFYGECGDFDHHQLDNWLYENVISKLRFYNTSEKYWCSSSTMNNQTEAYGHRNFIADCLKEWLESHGKCEMWSDCLSYDWVLFNSLYGNAFNIPINVYYIPFDICTLFKVKNIDPDINREEFADLNTNNSMKHNALWDAKVIKSCYEKLMRI